jgi:hypothetical protein
MFIFKHLTSLAPRFNGRRTIVTRPRGFFGNAGFDAEPAQGSGEARGELNTDLLPPSRAASG